MHCPICNKPSFESTKPFCSNRCKDLDLNRWFTGSYAIPIEQDDDEDGDEATNPIPSDE